MNKKDDLLMNSFCLYIDLLGFTNYMNAGSYEKRTENLNRYLKLIEGGVEWYLASCTTPLWRDDYESRIFSDNIVIRIKLRDILPNTSNDGERELKALLEDIQYLILTIIDFGFVVRGALTIGELFINETTVYGLALVEAYTLESKEAIFPRVILSNGVEKLIKEHLKDLSSKYSTWL